MPKKLAQITSGNPQDNEAGGHNRQVLNFQQHPNRLPFINNKTGKAVDSTRGPNIKPYNTLIICPKRKARLQEDLPAPNSYHTVAEASLKNEAAKDEKALPPPKRQRRNASLSAIRWWPRTAPQPEACRLR
ncbi:hypothetical protein PG994_002492 [Apiospora phragmitis]|uniref:Uncharacterized protein n=1 Tax=Apiospora phragmitis TaxID=2905665 RepID=A0ABR1W5A8_9PEZI